MTSGSSGHPFHEKPSLRIPNADPDDSALTVFYRFAFQGLVLNEFKDNDDLTRADRYLDELGFNDEFSMSNCVTVILVNLGLLAIAFYLALRFLDFEQR
jgi:hypothetical protein